MSLGGVILDGGRYFTTTPYVDGFSLTGRSSWDVTYMYMVKDKINYLVHEFYYKDDGDDAKYSRDRFVECILIFESDEEHQLFNKYASKNWL